MGCNGVANVVTELQRRGFNPRRLGDEAWEAICPVHKGMDHALSITRNSVNHLELECRGNTKCRYARNHRYTRIYQRTRV